MTKFNKYIVQTGWDEDIDNLFPDKIHRYPQFEGDIEVLAINKEIGMLTLFDIENPLLCPVVGEITAKDIEGTKTLPKSPIPYMGIMNFIAN